MIQPNPFLIVAALLNALAALLHVAIIFFGPSWYRFFGAGERMVRLAQSGHWYAPAITLSIALILAVWALFALSGSGMIRPLPLLKPALCAITAIYLLRGSMIVPMVVFARAQISPFWYWSSAICLIFGALHLAGLVQVWPRL